MPWPQENPYLCFISLLGLLHWPLYHQPTGWWVIPKVPAFKDLLTPLVLQNHYSQRFRADRGLVSILPNSRRIPRLPGFCAIEIEVVPSSPHSSNLMFWAYFPQFSPNSSLVGPYSTASDFALSTYGLVLNCYSKVKSGSFSLFLPFSILKCSIVIEWF